MFKKILIANVKDKSLVKPGMAHYKCERNKYGHNHDLSYFHTHIKSSQRQRQRFSWQAKINQNRCKPIFSALSARSFNSI